jgi:DNA-binding HxlR family transcriptional regulator
MAARQSQHICLRFQAAVELMAKRWTPLILQLLKDKPRRYSELYEQLEVVSEKMLGQRLRELEGADIIERRVIDEKPVRVEYHLTGKGRALSRVVGGLERWAERWIAQPTLDNLPQQPR